MSRRLTAGSGAFSGDCYKHGFILPGTHPSLQPVFTPTLLLQCSLLAARSVWRDTGHSTGPGNRRQGPLGPGWRPPVSELRNDRVCKAVFPLLLLLPCRYIFALTLWKAVLSLTIMVTQMTVESVGNLSQRTWKKHCRDLTRMWRPSLP